MTSSSLRTQVVVDAHAARDVFVPSLSVPSSAVEHDLLLISPAQPHPSATEYPLLYKLPLQHKADDDPHRIRKHKPQVVVNSFVVQSFPWVKRRDDVVVSVLPNPAPPEFVASHVELYFANIYLGRADMFRLSLSLVSTVLFLNQRILLPGSTTRIRVGRIYNQRNDVVRSAFIDDQTKIVFRSESARCVIFIEVAEELWHFEEDGSLLREKCDLFLADLFDRFYNVQPPTSHTVSIILYGRVIYEDNGEGEEERAPLSRGEDNTLYRDFYKVILDLSPSPPASIVRTVSSEIRAWQQQVLLRTRPSGEQKLSGRIAFAHESNILEATNLALNSFEEHWIDRDLQRTGLSLIVITAGTSFYHVSKTLLRVTTERMLSHGVGLDLISLSKTPLHTVPLFAFRGHEPGLSDELGSLLSRSLSDPDPDPRFAAAEDQRDPLYYDSPKPAQETSVYYAEPLFIFCSFFGRQVDKPYRIDRFMPRARCYELFSQGIGERIPIAIPLLPSNAEHEKEEETWSFLSEQEKRQGRRDRYDAGAVGGNSDRPDLASWSRASGVSAISVGSAQLPTEDVAPRKQRPTKESTVSVDLPPLPPPRGRANTHRTVSSAVPILGAAERERGRERRLSDVGQRIPSSTRSRTPVGRVQRPRSPSTGAASIRTVSSARTDVTKASRAPKTSGATPALMARFAPPPEAGAKEVPRTAWSRIWNRQITPTARSTAAPPALQRVEAFPNVKPALDLEESSTTSDSRRSSHATIASITSSDSPTGTEPSVPIPTQPISISSRTARTRDADRPTAKKVAPSSVGLPNGFTPISGPAAMGKLGEGVKSTASRLNPSKPGKRSVGLKDQARRWASILIRHTNDQRSVNWVSITRGACLPMTTDYLPTSKDIEAHYSDYRYSVPTASLTSSFLLRTDNPGRSPTLELITELISQRLSHGFQICTPADAVGALDEVNIATSKTTIDVLAEMHKGDPTAVYLSLSNQIHRISFERRSQTVVVKILRRRQTWAHDPYAYGALVWPQGAECFAYEKLAFPFPSMIDPADWEHLDRLVAGAEKPDLRPGLRYWRTRLVLLPAASVPNRDSLVAATPALQDGEVTDDDIQFQGFLTWMSLIEALRWVPPGGEREHTDVQTTSKFAPEWAEEMAAKAPQPQSEPSALGTTVDRPTSSWLKRMTAAPLSRDSESPPNGGGEGDRSPSPTRGTSGESTPPPPPRTRVDMTYSVILDLDLPKRSDRAERVLAHFDRSHNSQAAYHIEFTWLAGSGKIIDNTIQSWARGVTKWGLNLIEVSSRPVESRHNPFQRATHVGLARPPPEIVEGTLHKYYYEAGLLTHLGFFLDVGADDTFSPSIDVQYSYRRAASTTSQYIHRSGTLLVSILGGKNGFAFVPNRIFCARAREEEKVGEVVRELEGLCGDEEALGKLWDKLGKKVGGGKMGAREGESASASVGVEKGEKVPVEGE